MNAETHRSDSWVSAIIFTLNEERNLPSCLNSLDWCDDIFVVDSHSTDATREICETRKVPFVQHAFEGFGSQRNWALRELPLRYDWVLILDADERVPPELAEELMEISRSKPLQIGAYRLRRRFYMWGKWLRYSSLYPNWVVRFVHREKVKYINRGHSETQEVIGKVGAARGFLIDENLKELSAWFERQVGYARKDAEYELESTLALSTMKMFFNRDPLLRRGALKTLASSLPFRGFLYFFYSYVIRLGFLDGKSGYVFCRMKAMYQVMIEANRYDLQKSRRFHGS